MNIVSLLNFIVRHPLNRTAPLTAVGRLARWQVASRLIAGPIALPFVNDTKLLSVRGMTGSTGNWYCGLHEPSDMSFVLHALRPTDLFADIGANVGSYTILAGGAAGAKVVAVEPLPATFDRLMANVRINDLIGRVEAHCCGLSHESGVLRFTSGLDTMNRVALEGDTATTEVPVTTLDALCGSRRPFLIKIDVEGHELAVLDGGAAVLGSQELSAVIMETNESGLKFGVADATLTERMAQFGFKTCTYDFRTRSLAYAPKGRANTIFVRDIEMLNARCQTAPRFQLTNGMI